jgi:hypothetical protein
VAGYLSLSGIAVPVFKVFVPVSGKNFQITAFWKNSQ